MVELGKYYTSLAELKEPYCILHFKAETNFKACIIASFSKAIDLGVSLFKETDEDESYFKTSCLRGLCEEIIELLYIEKMLAPNQNEIIMALVAINLAKDLSAQEQFFKRNHPIQPILGSSVWTDKQKPTDEIKAILNSKGIKGEKLPPVEQMAQKVNLSELYSYMYRATSNFVHFNPNHLIRMGWGKDMKEARFSITHFYYYYLSFNRFYMSYLTILLCKTFKDQLGLNGEILNVITQMETDLNSRKYWPEIVTFEEMNLKRPAEFTEPRRILPPKKKGQK